MKTIAFFSTLTLTTLATALPSAAADKPAGIPAGYKLLYAQTFDDASALKQFVMTDPKAWKAVHTDAVSALALTRQSKYKPPYRSPLNMAMIADRVFGDFVLEAEFQQTGREYGHRDMCVFFDMVSPEEFYYVHIATRADDHAHNVFIVNHAARTKIAKKTTKGVNWGLNVWHKVRLERNAAQGTIKVYFDDLTTPIMVAEDKTFARGYLGFGSFDDTGMVDNIRVWGPSVTAQKTTFFKRN